MSAALTVRRTPCRDWQVSTATGCGCEIGGYNGTHPSRVFIEWGNAIGYATEHAATHACPSARASGEPCSPYCTDCGGRGRVA